jgi:hypothetical protein
MNGYQSSDYASALSEFGSVVHLPLCDGWLLEREIAGNDLVDAAGCYPLFSCRNWQGLGADVAALTERYVAVAMVVDPFSGLDGGALKNWFPDVCCPFKEHAVVDLERDWRHSISAHHRRNIRAAARSVAVEQSDTPYEWLPSWCDLYSHLIVRHEIDGIARFSRESFERQFRVPGLTAFRAMVGSETVAMLLWYISDAVAYYHLGACKPLGYEHKAMFALFDVALGHFSASGLRWAALGAGAGWQQTSTDGLTRFKQGWANDARTAWFCGRILNADSYRRLTQVGRETTSPFFPAYRQPAPSVAVRAVGA